MPKIYRSCPVCVMDDSNFIYENSMAYIGGFDMSYTVVCCNHCGFYYAQNLADSSTFDHYYKFFSKYDTRGDLSDVDEARINYAVSFLEGRVDKNSTILDLGCGVGALLGRLKMNGWQHLLGLDPAPNAAQRAKERYGITEIRCGTLSNAHEVINLKEVNLVCIMSVLEHLPNLNQDLKQLLANLPNECLILLEVPATEFFSNDNCEPFGEFSLEHIQYFDSNSLNNLMNSLGAETLALELVELPMVASGALLGLFEWKGQTPLHPDFRYLNTNCMEVYKNQSQEKLDLAISRVPNGPIIIYGAGSHTARLLTTLEVQTGCSIHSIVDNNPNLVGKKIGKWTVQPTSVICLSPEIPVLVSSFRSQSAIAATLHEMVPNPIILMYQ